MLESPYLLSVRFTATEETEQAVAVSMRRYKKSGVEVFNISLFLSRRKRVNEILSEVDVREIRRTASNMDYLEAALSPFVSLASSYLQQSVPIMTIIHDLNFMNEIVSEVICRKETITYLKPSPGQQKNEKIVVFFDAGFPHSGEKRKVAQEGYVGRISLGTWVGSVFHTIIFVSKKQQRVCQSSDVAETIAVVGEFGYARQT